MKSSKSATSIVEAMIVMLIVVLGIVGMYDVFSSSQKISTSTAHKIQAIQIAREGIEAIKNIRDTNWIIYGADNKNCWNSFNYNPNCVGDATALYDIASGSYIVSKSPSNRWNLLSKPHSTTFNSTYRNNFQVSLTPQGFYTQSGSIIPTKPLFTREIQITYIEDGQIAGDQGTNEQKMRVTSLVRWNDNSSSKNNKVKFSTILTNWRE